jgi:hypothetical protein
MHVEKEVSLTLELKLKLTNTEANLLRVAMSRGSGEDMSRKAAKQFFKSLRARESRFTLAELP